LNTKTIEALSSSAVYLKSSQDRSESRLQKILEQHTGLDPNQGANRKGIHSVHKATVVMNIIADARLRKKPLHIIYSDIKGAFPSVPY
jgi:hypothetical protein